ncbi:Short chain dehydrogenase, partial [Lachnellula subtilissima]
MPIQAKHLTPYPRLDPANLKSEFAGKTILITGGGYGIGASIATSFATAGASHLILAGRTSSKLSTTASSLTSTFPDLKVSTFTVGISSKTNVAALFESLKTSPDVLVNNAGYMSKVDKFGDAELGEWWKAFEINVFGTALVTQSFLKHRQGLSDSATAALALAPAVVITINTQGAYSQPFRAPGLSSYVASKAALLRLAEALQDDVPA